MNKIFKLKVKAYTTDSDMFEKLQDGIRPDCILYTGSAAIYPNKYGISGKKWHKAIDKIFDGTKIPDNLHIMIYVKYNKPYFETTHAVGKPEEHTVFHEDIYKKSLNNFIEFTL